MLHQKPPPLPDDIAAMLPPVPDAIGFGDDDGADTSKVGDETARDVIAAKESRTAPNATHTFPASLKPFARREIDEESGVPTLDVWLKQHNFDKHSDTIHKAAYSVLDLSAASENEIEVLLAECKMKSLTKKRFCNKVKGLPPPPPPPPPGAVPSLEIWIKTNDFPTQVVTAVAHSLHDLRLEVENGDLQSYLGPAMRRLTLRRFVSSCKSIPERSMTQDFFEGNVEATLQNWITVHDFPMKKLTDAAESLDDLFEIDNDDIDELGLKELTARRFRTALVVLKKNMMTTSA